LGGIWRFRGVLVTLSRKDFQVRYKRATLGVLWSIAMPLLQSVVLVFIFSRVGGFGSGHTYSYAGFVLAGMVPWVYVSTCVVSSTTAIVEASGLTDKIWFPRAVLTLVPPGSNLVMLGTSTVILLAVLPLLGAPVALRLFLLVPAVALAIGFSCAVGMLLGALYVYFRDLKFLVQAVVLVWLYVTPVVYPPTALGGAARWLDFNPLTGITGLFQTAAVGAPQPSARSLVIAVATTVVVLIVAVGIHRRHDRLFVDLL
jgi:ABC-type polysaccharide/polyol phosphate export permease